MIVLKPGVRIHGLSSEMVLGLQIAWAAWQELDLGPDMVVTSAVEGAHSAGSLHYVGDAVDLRLPAGGGVPEARFKLYLSQALGEDFDVVVESDHVHVEFQPKRPY